jgi:hypothetical protein
MHRRFAHLRVHGEWFDDSSGEITAFCEGGIDLGELRKVFVRIVPDVGVWGVQAFFLDASGSRRIQDCAVGPDDVFPFIPGRVGYFWAKGGAPEHLYLSAGTAPPPPEIPEIVKATVRDVHEKWKRHGRYDFSPLGLTPGQIREILESIL